MGNKYYENNETMHPSVQHRWDGKLVNEISVKNVTAANLQWLLDVIADSRSDIVERDNNLSAAHVNISDLLLLGAARKNLETIMSKILGVNVIF